jgi:hypothetical protein
MKRISTIIALGAITIFMSNATFAMQGRSQGGRPTGTGAPSNPEPAHLPFLGLFRQLAPRLQSPQRPRRRAA